MMIMIIAQPNSPGELGGNHGDFITVVIAQYNGDLYRASVRLGNPPKFNSRNLMNVPDADLEPVTDHVLMHTFVLCDVPTGTKVFLGLFGGPSGCSEYDILPEAFSGACVAGATASARSRRR